MDPTFFEPEHSIMIDKPTIVEVPMQRTATIHLNIPGMDMPKHMDPAIQEILQVLAEQGLKPSGPMFTYHHRMPSATFDFEVGFPVEGVIQPSGRVKASELPAVKVARTIHHGPYEGLQGAWMAFGKWITENELDAEPRFFERYLGDPSKQDPSEYRTEINRILRP